MTATAEVILPEAPDVAPVSMVHGARMLVRGAQRLIGASLAMAALGLWLVPGSSLDSDVLLFKLVLSLAGLLAGFGLMTSSIRPHSPEIEIDTIRREVRLVRNVRGGKPVVLERCAFVRLAHAEVDETVVRLWDHNGVFLAEFCPPDRNAFNSLVAGLQDEGKLG